MKICNSSFVCSIEIRYKSKKKPTPLRFRESFTLLGRICETSLVSVWANVENCKYFVVACLWNLTKCLYNELGTEYDISFASFDSLLSLAKLLTKHPTSLAGEKLGPTWRYKEWLVVLKYWVFKRKRVKVLWQYLKIPHNVKLFVTRILWFSKLYNIYI